MRKRRRYRHRTPLQGRFSPHATTSDHVWNIQQFNANRPDQPKWSLCLDHSYDFVIPGNYQNVGIMRLYRPAVRVRRARSTNLWPLLLVTQNVPQHVSLVSSPISPRARHVYYILRCIERVGVLQTAVPQRSRPPWSEPSGRYPDTRRSPNTLQTFRCHARADIDVVPATSYANGTARGIIHSLQVFCRETAIKPNH